MKPKPSVKKSPAKAPAERVVQDIRRATRRHFSAEDKIRIVLDGLRGDDSIAELCRKEGIAQSLYYTWSKAFMEAGKRRLAGDTARAATKIGSAHVCTPVTNAHLVCRLLLEKKRSLSSPSNHRRHAEPT